MTRNIFQWLKEAFQKRSNNSASDRTANDDHVVLTQQHVIDAIVQALRPMREAENMNALTLWAHDARIHSILTAPDTTELLRTALDNALLYSLGRGEILVRPDMPDDSVATTNIIDRQLYVSFGMPAQQAPRQTAQCSVSILDNNGSLQQDHYVIQTPGDDRPRKSFIGRGNTTRHNGHLHANDIVIRTDDPDTVIQDLNNHVSSAHACIVAKRGMFFLQALPGGCRYLKGSPTKIIHDGETYEMANIYMLQPLRDGDIIELGRKVLLKVSLS